MSFLRLIHAGYFLSSRPGSGVVLSALIGLIYLSTPLTAALAYSSKMRRTARRLRLPVTLAFFGSVASVALTVLLRGPIVLMMFSTSALVLASLTASALFASQLILRLPNRR